MDVVLHWIHLAAAAVWAGSMVFVGAALIPALGEIHDPDTIKRVLQKMEGKFSSIRAIALVALILTGSYRLYRSGSDIAWFSSPYGIAFGIKLQLVVAMIGLSLLCRIRLDKNRGVKVSHEVLQAKIAFLRTIVKLQIALAVLILFLAAFLRMNPF